MYSWGGDTSDWKGSKKYKYDSAKKPYLDKLAADASARGPRSYATKGSPDSNLVSTKGKAISSSSKNPIVLAVDVTGSMSSWPAEIFDRLPLLYQTLSQYRNDIEICFAAIGDANCDNYPLQVNDFGKGVDLEDKLKALGCEGGGGGQISESYELFAYFIKEHCETPNATSPFLFIYGDEKFYNQISPEQVAHYIGDKLQGPVDSKEVWEKLMQRFNVYYMHKPYGNGGESAVDQEVVKHWAGVLGKQRIIELPSYDRAVDVAIGLVAKHWGKFGDFKDNMSARHDDASVKDAVYSSLRHIHEPKDPNSVIDKPDKSKSRMTKSLSEMADSK